jgi:flavin reductase (DIM6/NTAB) family NADH-FMN oxidoreductase RutF
MYYETKKNDHGLLGNPFKSCIVPRPIGWITSFDQNGVLNLAPYSYFNAVSDTPPMIIFSATSKHQDGGLKDTLRNVEETKEFVVNIATWEQRAAVNISSAHFDRGVSEVEQTDLETIPSFIVKPPRIKDSPIHLECVYYQSIQLPVIDEHHTNRMVIAKVVGVHIDDSIIVDGQIDVTKFKPIARLGYNEYVSVEKIFTMERPQCEEISL